MIQIFGISKTQRGMPCEIGIGLNGNFLLLNDQMQVTAYGQPNCDDDDCALYYYDFVYAETLYMAVQQRLLTNTAHRAGIPVIRDYLLQMKNCEFSNECCTKFATAYLEALCTAVY